MIETTPTPAGWLTLSLPALPAEGEGGIKDAPQDRLKLESDLNNGLS
ncbi:hypothetical protein L5876_11345 [Hyphobacterium sp. SN044]|nr:hypothetical protein [Hyphobacterium sp. SN044]MCF8880411.1 hypothetical protein [Hyphobacterium sp. SN044]